MKEIFSGATLGVILVSAIWLLSSEPLRFVDALFAYLIGSMFYQVYVKKKRR